MEQDRSGRPQKLDPAKTARRIAQFDAMKPITFNPVVIETFARLHGVQAFLETMNEGIPTVEEKAHRYLEQLAEKAGWEKGDYTVERSVLDAKFHLWVPTFASWSAAIILHSIVETQLDAFAEYMGQQRGAQLRAKDVAGKDIERSVRYLKLALSIDVKADRAWSRLKDLQSLRNIIVHRGGKRGESPEHQKTVDALVKKYPQNLELRTADGFHEQIWVSMNLCRDFVQDVDGFFERVFRASGLPSRHIRLDD